MFFKIIVKTYESLFLLLDRLWLLLLLPLLPGEGAGLRLHLCLLALWQIHLLWPRTVGKGLTANHQRDTVSTHTRIRIQIGGPANT